MSYEGFIAGRAMAIIYGGALIGCALGGIACYRRSATSISARNIQELEWLEEHPPAHTTPEEARSIQHALEEQRAWLARRRWWTLSTPPHVDWWDIPMDDAFQRRFYAKH